MTIRNPMRTRHRTASVVLTALVAVTTAMTFAPVAQAASGHSGKVHTAGPSLTVRSGPSHADRAVGSIRNGAGVAIVCQTLGTSEKGTYGTSRWWDKLAAGGYVADVFIYTGSDGRVAPNCAKPGPTTRRLPKTLAMSAKGLAFLTTFEGLRLTPYNDSNGFCTVGVGHLLHRSRCTSADHAISKAKAQSLLSSDVKSFSTGVARVLPKTPMYQYEFDAMVSFAFNVGVGVVGGKAGFTSSKVWEDLHRAKPDYAAVPGHLLNWTKTPCGAHSRRINEGHLFKTGSYVITSHC
jgi:GH24 family phage-related lysozyme (muramidase)/uncharacterized protein YraI